MSSKEEMNREENSENLKAWKKFTGHPHPDYIKKQAIVHIFRYFGAILIWGFGLFYIGREVSNAIEYASWDRLFWNFYGYIILLGGGIWTVSYIIYQEKYVENFQFSVKSTSIDINFGVLTKKQVIIPYVRIQNINKISTLFDRMFGLWTLEIETAGAPIVMGRKKSSQPEGFIPGMKDPNIVLKKLREGIRKQSGIDTGVGNIFFNNPDLALDHFISIFLDKMKEGKNIKNRIKEVRKSKGITQSELAEAVGTSRQTISHLENREYNPALKLAFRISQVLETPVDDLFIIEQGDMDPEND